MNSVNSQTTFRKSYWIDSLGENVHLEFIKGERKISVNCFQCDNEIAEFDFRELNSRLYIGDDSAIFIQRFKRKGIYTFVIDTIEKEFDCKVIPSAFLSEQGKRFWKNRTKQINHGKERLSNNYQGGRSSYPQGTNPQ